MDNQMTSVTRHTLRRICRKLVLQGHSHEQNIIDYYQIMYEAARQEFTEDNKPTLDDFLTECHERSLSDDSS